MYRYRNANTGDVVELDTRSVRLDHLPNWSLVGGDGGDTGPGGECERPSGSGLARPARNASAAKWRAYVVARGLLTEVEAAAHTRAELVALFGDR